MEDLMAHEDEELELDEVARRFSLVKGMIFIETINSKIYFDMKI